MPYWRLFYHVIWTTRDRLPLLTPEIERDVYRLLTAARQELGSRVYCVNGVADHVHVVATIPPKIAVADWVKRLKGSSSRAIGRLAAGQDLYWQPGYGAVSFGQRNLSTVIGYVERQKEHHRNKRLIAFLESAADVSDGPA
jgi:putative transposase